MNILVLKKFNNYFNRKIIKYDSLEDYQNASSSYITLAGINFNPNDGVRTELVLGQGSLGTFFDFEKTNAADYLVCYSVDPGSDESDDSDDIDIIESRWFITEVKRTRGGQYVLSLKRDSVADNFNSLLQCPAYIRKGVLSDANPLIVNNEGVSVNQILEDQIPLKDDSGSAWLVGYMAKNFGVTVPVAVQVNHTAKESVSIEDIASELGIKASDLANALTTNKNNPTAIVNDNIEIVSWVNYPDNTSLEYKILAGSQDGLNSFTYGTPAPIIQSHNPTSDCYAREVIIPYSSNLNTTKVINLWKQQCTAHKADLKAAWETVVGHPLFTRSVYTKLKDLADNNVLLYKAGVYYNIRIGTVSGPTNTGNTYNTSALASPFSAMCSAVVSGYNQGLDPSTTTHMQMLSGGKIFINYNELIVNFYLEEATAASGLTTIDYTMSSTRNACKDQCFDIFAIPYNNLQVKNGGTILEGIGDDSQELSVKLAQEIVQNETTHQIYDLQLLPYCPIPTICSNNQVDVTNLTAGKDYDFITQTGEYEDRKENNVYASSVEYEPGMYEGSAIWQSNINFADVVSWGYTAVAENQDQEAQEMLREWEATNTTAKSNVGGKAKFMVYAQIQDPQTFDHADINVGFWVTYNVTGTINKTVVLYPKKASFSVDIHKSLSLNDEMKLESNCNNYRIVSPNYQGSFDFNVAKNGGSVSQFFAHCTYKPFTPYIRVVPEFNWLYSTNYPKECRGLICGGDFSIGIINDKWQEYKLQNKNYQNIFNREIQSLDIQQSIQRTQQYATGGIKQFSDAASGAATGAILGGGWGAAIGATVAGGASTAGYIADNVLMERQLVEQRQLAYDKFGLQLGNIQALPYTLTKVGSFDADSMIWPFLEYYTCTQEEKEAFRNKIKYEGMTVGIVDMLGNYMTTDSYLQADLIRNDTIIDDSHLLEDIYIELTKGVYL